MIMGYRKGKDVITTGGREPRDMMNMFEAKDNNHIQPAPIQLNFRIQQ